MPDYSVNFKGYSGTYRVNIGGSASNSACNVYRLMDTNKFIKAVNGVSLQTIFTDVGSAVYTLRSYPFDASKLPSYGWGRYYIPFHLLNTSLVDVGGVQDAPRLFSFPASLFDGRSGSPTYKILSSARRFGDAQIYIPYIGFTPIDLNDLYEHVLKVCYTIDLATGNTAVTLLSDDVIVEVINGTIGEDHSFANTNAAQMFKQNLATGASLVAGAAATALSGGSMVGIAAGLAGGVINAAANTIDRVNRGQIGGAGLGRSGPQFPYIMVRIWDEDPARLRQFAALHGRPLEQVRRLDRLTGYTEFSEIHLDGLGTALEAEKDEIRSLLQEGVIL